jgi:hypothetical protein
MHTQHTHVYHTTHTVHTQTTLHIHTCTHINTYSTPHTQFLPWFWGTVALRRQKTRTAQEGERVCVNSTLPAIASAEIIIFRVMRREDREDRITRLLSLYFLVGDGERRSEGRQEGRRTSTLVWSELSANGREAARVVRVPEDTDSAPAAHTQKNWSPGVAKGLQGPAEMTWEHDSYFLLTRLCRANINQQNILCSVRNSNISN